MKQMKVVEKNFTTTIDKMMDNTLNFENSSIFTKYVSDDDKKGGTSIYGLYTIDSVVLDTLVPYLKTISEVKLFNEDEEFKYRQRPMLLSKETYGYIDYWYILLAVNNYISPYDFKGFKKLYIPTKDKIEDLINTKLYKNVTIGINNAT